MTRITRSGYSPASNLGMTIGAGLFQCQAVNNAVPVGAQPVAQATGVELLAAYQLQGVVQVWIHFLEAHRGSLHAGSDHIGGRLWRCVEQFMPRGQQQARGLEVRVLLP